MGGWGVRPNLKFRYQEKNEIVLDFLAALAALYLTLYTYNRREPTYNHGESTYNHREPTYNHREPTYNRGEPLTATLEIEDE